MHKNEKNREKNNLFWQIFISHFAVLWRFMWKKIISILMNYLWVNCHLENRVLTISSFCMRLCSRILKLHKEKVKVAFWICPSSLYLNQIHNERKVNLFVVHCYSSKSLFTFIALFSSVKQDSGLSAICQIFIFCKNFLIIFHSKLKYSFNFWNKF